MPPAERRRQSRCQTRAATDRRSATGYPMKRHGSPGREFVRSSPYCDVACPGAVAWPDPLRRIPLRFEPLPYEVTRPTRAALQRRLEPSRLDGRVRCFRCLRLRLPSKGWTGRVADRLRPNSRSGDACRTGRATRKSIAHRVRLEWQSGLRQACLPAGESKIGQESTSTRGPGRQVSNTWNSERPVLG